MDSVVMSDAPKPHGKSYRNPNIHGKDHGGALRRTGKPHPHKGVHEPHKPYHLKHKRHGR